MLGEKEEIDMRRGGSGGMLGGERRKRREGR